MAGIWMDDWDRARRHHEQWWRRKGMVAHITAPRRTPWEPIPPPRPARSPEERWLDVSRRVHAGIYHLSRTAFVADAFPNLDIDIGPGSLGLFLGATPRFSMETVWYDPVITDPERHPELRFDPANRWFKVHCDLLEEAMRQCRGRYVVGLPDLIENIDTLAQLRDPQTLMMDLIERPAWVQQRITQINRAYFDAFDALVEHIRQPWGGNGYCSFYLWGPGRTAKVQCDAGAMISTEMFRRFVLPALTEQCRWLDYALFHLDGTTALHHLDALLEIEALDAIEWTPQAGIEPGGDPRWYPLYQRILSAGKSVQVVGVRPEQVRPLLDAIGGAGVYFMCRCGDEEEAWRVAEVAERYRPVE